MSRKFSDRSRAEPGSLSARCGSQDAERGSSGAGRGGQDAGRASAGPGPGGYAAELLRRRLDRLRDELPLDGQGAESARSGEPQAAAAPTINIHPSAPPAVVELCGLIAESLEDGLLRHSRRQELLRHAARLGLSEFHAHLLIAQVQCGGSVLLAEPSRPGRPNGDERLGPRLAAVGVLALGILLALIQLAGV